MRRVVFACGIVVAAWTVQPVLSIAVAQESGASERRSAGSKRAKRAPRAKRDKRARNADQAEKPSDAPVPERETEAAPTDSRATTSSALDGSGHVRKEGDTEVKTLEFTGLDIEGQLKTPQLLYFLTRLRAEFDRPRLPRRSFMPELERTSGEKALR